MIGIQNGDDITAGYASDGAAATVTVAGSPYPITASLTDPTGKLGNYTVTLNTGNLTVTPAAPTVNVSDAGGTYCGMACPATASVTGVSGIPAASLEGMTPIMTYYVGNAAGGTGFAAAPGAAGTYTVVAGSPAAPITRRPEAVRRPSRSTRPHLRSR